MVIKQNQVERITEAALVLSDVPETMSRREWFQVSHNVGGSSETIVAFWREFRQVFEWILTTSKMQRNAKNAIVLLLLGGPLFMGHPVV